MQAFRHRYVLPVICLGVLGVVVWVNAGTMDPPAGPIDPTMKDLDTVEPRIPITTLSGSAQAKYVITEPGSYYFSGDVYGEAGKHGIAIDADNVTIDLMGYALIGGTDQWTGIYVAQPHTNIEVRNGTVRNWRNYGITLLNTIAPHVRDIRASHNGSDAIYVAHGAIVERCTVSQNSSTGIHVYNGSVVRDCTAIYNGGTGIVGSGGDIIVNCVSRNNEGSGFYIAGAGTIKGCTAIQNFSHGIHAGGISSVIDNTCRENGYTTNNGAGIYVSDGWSNRIEGNTTVGNYPRGIDVDSTENLIIKNVSGHNTTNYDIVANNGVGPIINKSNIASNTNPYANYEY